MTKSGSCVLLANRKRSSSLMRRQSRRFEVGQLSQRSGKSTSVSTETAFINWPASDAEMLSVFVISYYHVQHLRRPPGHVGCVSRSHGSAQVWRRRLWRSSRWVWPLRHTHYLISVTTTDRKDTPVWAVSFIFFHSCVKITQCQWKVSGGRVTVAAEVWWLKKSYVTQ